MLSQDVSYRMRYLNDLFLMSNRPAAYGDYSSYHKDRFDYIFKTCIQLHEDKNTKVLDVGRSPLSKVLSEYYNDITTLGFPLEQDRVKNASGDLTHAHMGDDLDCAHIVYDLNDAQELRPIETAERFALIVFAEVIEHLYTAPELTLFVVSELLEPGGHIIIQTPNAAALHKRLRLLRGLNPYERIRINNKNPGHYREYTKSELIEIAQTVGLNLTRHEYRDYFSVYGSQARKAAILLNRMLATAVPQFARGQTLIVSRPINTV